MQLTRRHVLRLIGALGLAGVPIDTAMGDDSLTDVQWLESLRVTVICDNANLPRKQAGEPVDHLSGLHGASTFADISVRLRLLQPISGRLERGSLTVLVPGFPAVSGLSPIITTAVPLGLTDADAVQRNMHFPAIFVRTPMLHVISGGEHRALTTADYRRRLDLRAG